MLGISLRLCKLGARYLACTERVMDSKSFILSRRKRGRRKLTSRTVCLMSMKPDYIQTRLTSTGGGSRTLAGILHLRVQFVVSIGGASRDRRGTAEWTADGLVNGSRFAPVGGRGSHSVCWAHNQSEVEVDQWADAQHHH